MRVAQLILTAVPSIARRGSAGHECRSWVCAVHRRRFPVGASPTWQTRLRLGKFVFSDAKRLFRQHRPGAEVRLQGLARKWPGAETCSDLSAPADSIDRTTTIHRSSRPYGFSRRSSRDRPRSQHHAGPRDATGGIIHVLAVHHGGAGHLGARGYESGNQQGSC
jgi:hypothetical protein